MVEADVSESFSLEKGDVFLLCTDGLTNMVEDEFIKSTINTENDPSKIARTLINEALINGGSDNITCIVVKIEDILM
ncbi:PP2C family protein-serine/threonine phosphatase [Acetivibrio straminisolvens]|uniref:PP2C family protein-serine/threonine phosphatase n=1 Tax=Acetivibrio straminisolvens TaxID=253314 RepID=UPI00243490CB|nr:SpoIIE family protein phosphatase [Acetivibrio straminisolvens]